MNILITGGNGFIARNLYKALRQKHDVLLTNRKSLDVLDQEAVSSFLNTNSVDIVVHTAVSGGRRTRQDSMQTVIENLKMFNNFVFNKHKFDAFIHFGSGAEFDRRTDISLAEEEDSSPIDYYGLSKLIIKREITRLKCFYNLRIFGCFGKDEEETRFIKSATRKIREGKPITIHKNRNMDFISIEDLCTVVEYYVDNFDIKELPKDINLCYTEKVSLLDVANKLNALAGKPLNNVVIQEPGLGNEYTGSPNKLENLRLNLLGLDKSLKKIMRKG